ncbi:Protein of unknown function [Gryllus bimaculatus]|nr:Protein of unknown function [Gryllus bimaculatus]
MYCLLVGLQTSSRARAVATPDVPRALARTSTQARRRGGGGDGGGAGGALSRGTGAAEGAGRTVGPPPRVDAGFGIHAPRAGHAPRARNRTPGHLALTVVVCGGCGVGGDGGCVIRVCTRVCELPRPGRVATRTFLSRVGWNPPAIRGFFAPPPTHPALARASIRCLGLTDTRNDGEKKIINLLF